MVMPLPPGMDERPADLPASYRGVNRRPSVSAEVPMAPGEYVRAQTFPKTEAQAEAIREALKDNFLFNHLSYKQLYDIIEVRVFIPCASPSLIAPGEHVRRRGAARRVRAPVSPSCPSPPLPPLPPSPPPPCALPRAQCMFEKRVHAGEEVMTQGADGDNFYVVESGRFEAVKDSHGVVCVYDGRGTFGELALMYNCPRAATVVARTDGALWALDRLTFSRLLIADRQERAAVSTAWLAAMPVLDYLNTTEIAKLADSLVSQEFAAGATVFSQGEVGETFYLVEEVGPRRWRCCCRCCCCCCCCLPS
jgi:CRP-like cAMP-binding protein